MVYIYGVLVTIPSVICAGLILPKFLGNLERPTPSFLKADQPVDMKNCSFGVSILVPLIPAIIMISTTIANIWLVKDTPAWEVVNFIGSSPIAMFIAMVVAFVLFGTARGHDMQWVMNAFESAVKSIAMVILIIGAGGVLKQRYDTGIGDTIGMLMSHGNISPYIMAWLITVLIRLATGNQGVVSAMTAAGNDLYQIEATGQLVGVNPALLVLATAAVPTPSPTLTMHLSGCSKVTLTCQ